MTDEAVGRALDLAQQLLLDTARALEEAARKLRDYETGSRRLVAALEAVYESALSERDEALAEIRQLRQTLGRIADGSAEAATIAAARGALAAVAPPEAET